MYKYFEDENEDTQNEDRFFIPILLNEHPHFSISCKPCSNCQNSNWSHCNVNSFGDVTECDICTTRDKKILWN